MHIKHDSTISDMYDEYVSTMVSIRNQAMTHLHNQCEPYQEMLSWAYVHAREVMEGMVPYGDVEELDDLNSRHETELQSLNMDINYWQKKNEPNELDALHLIFYENYEPNSAREFEILMARNDMDSIYNEVILQMNSIFIYASGIFEKFITDILHIAIKKNKATRERYAQKFREFANGQYNKFRNEEYQAYIGDDKKMLAALNDMVSRPPQQGGFTLLELAKYVLGLENLNGLDDWERYQTSYKEIKERRNLLIHRGNNADKQYYQGLRNSNRKGKWKEFLRDTVFIPIPDVFSEGGYQKQYFLNSKWNTDFYFSDLSDFTAPVMNNSFQNFSIVQFLSNEPIPMSIIEAEPPFNLNINPIYLENSLETLIMLGSIAFSTCFQIRQSKNIKNPQSFVSNGVHNIYYNYCPVNHGHDMPYDGPFDFDPRFHWNQFESTDWTGRHIPAAINSDQWYNKIVTNIINVDIELSTSEATNINLLLILLNTVHLDQQYSPYEDYNEILYPILEKIEKQSPLIYEIANSYLLRGEAWVREALYRYREHSVQFDLIEPNDKQLWEGINLPALYANPLFRDLRRDIVAQELFKDPYRPWLELDEYL